MSAPAAAIVGVRTDGGTVDQVHGSCPYCRGRHSHRWYGELDGFAQDASERGSMPTCRKLVRTAELQAHHWCLGVLAEDALAALRVGHPGVPALAAGEVEFHGVTTVTGSSM
jgi:hypothetical protein